MHLSPQGQQLLESLQRRRFSDLPLSLAILRTALELAAMNPTPPTLDDVVDHLQTRRHLPVTREAVPVAWIDSIEKALREA